MVKTTDIKADNIKDLFDLATNLRSIATKWCDAHKDYSYEVSINKKDLLVKLRIEKH